MGLMSFVKSAGAAIFGSDEEEKKIEAEVQAQADAQREKLERLKKARALQMKVEELGLEIENADIRVEGSTVILGGKVADQATAEKISLAIGNINGIEAVDNRLEVENTEPEAQFHTVASGDTLGAIAQKYYGKASKYPVIFEANKPMLKDPDKIYPGQVLRIPPQED
ncbi:MAG: peptidoglycan-binding protein LysM [Thermoanaerobaculia bacterium]|nr:peptidoglycan-binding protein LysM [Thermoanaerobaculia bacterium]